jgi:cephalosporin hydroxylase
MVPKLMSRALHRIRRNIGPTIDIIGQYAEPNAAAPGRKLNDLEKYFYSAEDRALLKWHHYFDVYDTWFASYRNTPVRVLEIGVLNGGSLGMWRSYFGEDAIIFGIDVLPSCSAFNGESGQVRIGSRDDPSFLCAVVDEMNGLDLVIDDGSHQSPHMKKSFEVLFPLLSDGGVYVVEDTHASYWADHKGGYYWPGSFMNYVKKLIDDMHHWYHRKGVRNQAVGQHIGSIHIYDSMVVFRKKIENKPAYSNQGARRDVK